MVELLKPYRIAWGLFTNGITLTEGIAEQLFHANPGFFRVSLDAGNRRLYRKIYATEPEMFDVVKRNIITAGKHARRIGVNWFGVGFAVMPNTSISDIHDIRDTICELAEESDFGVSLASFRPRVIHHHNNEVVVPQRHSGLYRELAQVIREEIELPVLQKYGDRIRIDHKYGAFSDCDREQSPQGGWGGSWLVSLDHRAEGSIVSHLTGARTNPSAWGSALAGGDFLSAWQSEKRIEAQKRVINGDIPLPVANGFRALDAFIARVKEIFPDPISEARADKLMDGIETWDFHRSRRPEFVG